MARYNADKERELLLKAQQGDIRARKELHEMYRGALDSLVYRDFRNRNQPIVAIRSEAENLFDKFIDQWDPSRSNKPNTYFYGNIQKKLQRYVNEHANPVRITEQYSSKIGKYKDTVKELQQQLGRTPTNLEVQKRMNKKWPNFNLSEKDVARIKSDTRTTIFASTPVGSVDEGTTLSMGDLAFTEGENLLEDYKREVQIQEMMTKVNSLPERERIVFLHYYGLQGYPKLSYRELATKLGINKYKVQKHLQAAEGKLRSGSHF